MLSLVFKVSLCGIMSCTSQKHPTPRCQDGETILEVHFLQMRVHDTHPILASGETVIGLHPEVFLVKDYRHHDSTKFELYIETG